MGNAHKEVGKQARVGAQNGIKVVLKRGHEHQDLKTNNTQESKALIMVTRHR